MRVLLLAVIAFGSVQIGVSQRVDLSAAESLNLEDKSSVLSLRGSIDRNVRSFLEGEKVDRDELEAVIVVLSKIARPRSVESRREVAGLWKDAASALAESEGSTPLVLELLRTASRLDPEDEALAAELAFQQERQRIARTRIAAAASARSK